MKLFVIMSFLIISCSYQSFITEIHTEKLPEPCYEIVKEVPLDKTFKEVFYRDTCP